MECIAGPSDGPIHFMRGAPVALLMQTVLLVLPVAGKLPMMTLLDPVVILVPAVRPSNRFSAPVVTLAPAAFPMKVLWDPSLVGCAPAVSPTKRLSVNVVPRGARAVAGNNWNVKARTCIRI